jgi:pimeloyl-ACP methyl ester carboxylesterase
MNDPNLNRYDLLNARILCGASADAYGPFPSGEMIESGESDTHAMIVRTATDLFLVFRGTTDLRNWLTDIDCACDLEDGCKIHRGFSRALDSVFSRITAEILRPGYKNLRFWLAGHSLGGALAMLYAWRFFTAYHQMIFSGIYTFGQPRVGDRSFRDLYDFSGLKARTFRVVHANDIVCRVPWLLGSYRHAGHEVFYPTVGRDSSTASGASPGRADFEPMIDSSLLSKLPWDIRNAWRELARDKVALVADHHIDTYLRLFFPTAAGEGT